MDDKSIRRISFFGFIFFIILIFLIFFLDYEVKGAKRWIKFYNFTLQPSEIIKPFFVILSAWGISQTINGKKDTDKTETVGVVNVSRVGDLLINTYITCDQTINRIIYVPNKIINLVLK